MIKLGINPKGNVIPTRKGANNINHYFIAALLTRFDTFHKIINIPFVETFGIHTKLTNNIEFSIRQGFRNSNVYLYLSGN